MQYWDVYDSGSKQEGPQAQHRVRRWPPVCFSCWEKLTLGLRSADLKVLVEQKADVLVTLVQVHELEAMGIPHFFDKVRAFGIESIHYPIPDKWLPRSMDEVAGLVATIISQLRRNKRVVVHCNGGKGRTALVVVSVLVSLGMTPSEATDLVRSTRPGTLYNPAQILYVRALSLYRGAQPADIHQHSDGE